MNPSTTARTRYFAESALLPKGFARDVAIEVDGEGWIVEVEAGAPSHGAALGGVAVPGMPNLHSHAFQRAMAGLAERAGPEGDDFWSWRETMYRFLARLGPEEVEAIAAQLYAELLKAGYTAVAEFHYLHRDPRGNPYADPAELSRRIAAAAAASGIGLTLLPVLYQTSQFGGAPPSEGQKRFVLGTDDFLALVERLIQQHRGDPQIRIGVAPHSLRAVTPDALRAALAGAAALDGQGPIHMHVAEQVKELRDCVAWSGKRPVEWAVENLPVDARWCLVHGTQANEAELSALAATGAAVGLCPSTEANLGDGLFLLPHWLEAGGAFGIGTDANVATSPAEELRWLEYGQRLITKRRNLAERRPGASTGAALYRRALGGGAQAAGRAIGAIAPGQRADIVVLDADHPALAGRSEDALIDSWIFCASGNPVRDVMVGGRWVVRGGAHCRETAIAEAYRAALARLRS
ncbi:MAG TPA: formimidoylglutamate deiminase [Stellaceae bacterium]|nr:formimidoylglutamate deiminase [Stellaceae bacterium]